MNLKFSLTTIAVATLAVVSSAQFGAVNKADLEAKDGKQGVYGYFAPLNRFTDSSRNGVTFALERSIDGRARIGGSLTDFNGSNFYQLYYRQSVQNFDVQIGFVNQNFGGGLNSSDFSALGFFNVVKPKADGTQSFHAEVFAGLYRSDFFAKNYVQYGARISYPLTNGYSFDSTVWQIQSAGATPLVSIGIGYRF
jgi:hypothetical protein